MFVWDRETLRIVAVNAAALRLYGWSADELLAMTIRDIRPPEELPFFEASFADPSKSGGNYSRAARHRTNTGKVLDVVLEISWLTFEDRPAALVVVTDTTGIGDAERRFRLLVENSSDGISLTSADNVVQYVSPGGLRLLGYEGGSLDGDSAGLYAHPDDVARWTPPAPGETRHNVARIKHRDGSWRWIESSTRNLTHEPAVRAYVTNYRDITRRKLAEDALRRSEVNFRTLIEGAPAATFVHREGMFVYANPAAVAMLGHHHADELIGKPILDYIQPVEREELRRRMESLVDVGAVRVGRVLMLRADGSPFTVEGQAMLLDFDGVPSHVVIGHDISERDAMFARIAMADRMLAIGTLAAGVAHEINNPLAYVATNLETLAAELPNITPGPRSRLTEKMLQALVSDAREGVERVNSIVHDLRSLSRIDDQKAGPVDVASVMASSIKMTNNEIRHRARIVRTIEDQLPPVDVDASRLGQVFVNLLLNAAQAIEEGDANHNEIRISARTAAGGTQVLIEVADTGSGIAPSIIGRIFDPFFTTKAPGSGTGLGLAISQQIVRAMDGEITVESKLGAGSTFRVVLPVAAATETRPREMAPHAGSSRRVLIVDDEPAIGRSLQILLAPETEVVTAISADDALAQITRSGPFDAIVCDIMMPVSSGMHLYDTLGQAAPEYQRRMIFMTGGAFTPHARAFLSRLDRPHLEKPFSEQELRDAIARITT